MLFFFEFAFIHHIPQETLTTACFPPHTHTKVHHTHTHLHTQYTYPHEFPSLSLLEFARSLNDHTTTRRDRKWLKRFRAAAGPKVFVCVVFFRSHIGLFKQQPQKTHETTIIKFFWVYGIPRQKHGASIEPKVTYRRVNQCVKSALDRRNS